jgi:hypothetical protein
MHAYLATDLSPAVLAPDDDEIISVVRLPLARVPELIQSGEIQDAKSVAALLLAMRVLDEGWATGSYCRRSGDAKAHYFGRWFARSLRRIARFELDWHKAKSYQYVLLTPTFHYAIIVFHASDSYSFTTKKEVNRTSN